MIKSILALLLLSTQDTLCGIVICLYQIEKYKSLFLLLKLIPIVYLLKKDSGTVRNNVISKWTMSYFYIRLGIKILEQQKFKS